MDTLYIYLLVSPLVVKRSSEIVFNLQMVRDDWLEWIPHLDPVKEPLTPVTLVKVVLLMQYNTKISPFYGLIKCTEALYM